MDDDRSGKRRHPRITAALPVRVSTIEPERDQWTGRPFFRATREYCANVSRGGAFVLTSEPLAPGRRILIELQLPTGAPLEAIGRVAWTRRIMSPNENETEAGIGVEFLGAAPEPFSQLEQFIDTQDS